MSRPIGYLIRHRSLKACTTTVALPWVQLAPNPTYGVDGKCPTCMVPHPFKTYHLDLTMEGTCIVSQTVFDALCRAGAIDGVPKDKLAKFPKGGQVVTVKPLAVPFEYVSVVEPPPLTVGFGAKGGITDGEGRQLRGPGQRVMHVHQDFG